MTVIEWCDESWNPVTGCTPIGEGCKNCYARTMAMRLKAMGQHKYRNGFKVTCHLNSLYEPSRWQEPRRVFVCSMGDLYHPDIPHDFRNTVHDCIHSEAWSKHTFIVLTKRIKLAKAYLDRRYGMTTDQNPAWLGVSVSTQREADELIPILLQCPAAKRIVSYEPALEFINWAPFIKDINWLICGGESGPQRRAFDSQWAFDALDRCRDAGVPFFYKQGRDDQNRVVKMPLLDGRRWEEYPC